MPGSAKGLKMADASVAPEVGSLETDEVVDVTVEAVAPKFETIEQALAEIARLDTLKKEAFSERDKYKKTAREYEQLKTKQSETELQEQAKFKELYEQTQAKLTAFEQKQKEKVVAISLKAELEKAGVKAVDTASELIDRASIVLNEDGEVDVEALAAVVAGLKTKHPVLFKQPKQVELPDVKRATESNPVTGSIAKGAKTYKDIIAAANKAGIQVTGM